MLSIQAQDEIRSEIRKYPAGHARAAVMAALRIAQQEHGWVNRDVMEYIADFLEIEPIKVAEVATFYTMYDLKPIGRYKINLCTNITCALRGSDTITKYLNEKLGIGFGETTKDQLFTLQEVECLAACDWAPVALINTDYYEHLTPQKIDKILDSLP